MALAKLLSGLSRSSASFVAGSSVKYLNVRWYGHVTRRTSIGPGDMLGRERRWLYHIFGPLAKRM